MFTLHATMKPLDPDTFIGRTPGAMLLIRLRHAFGWSQETLASALGVTAFTIHRWETAKSVPPAPQLVGFALFFSLPELALPDRWAGEPMLDAAAVRRQGALDTPLIERALNRINDGRGLTGPALLHWGLNQTSGLTAWEETRGT